MESSRRPLIAGVLKVDEEDPEYSIHCDAYGLEMQVDDEWPVDTVIMVPPDYVSYVTEDVDLSDMGTVFAGAAYPAMSDGEPDFSDLEEPESNWVRIPAGTKPAEANIAILAALEADINVILELPSISQAGLTKVLADVDAEQFAKLAFAVPAGDEPDPNRVQADCARLRGMITEAFDEDAAETARIIATGNFDGENISPFLEGTDVDGVLLLNCHFHPILEILQAITEEVVS